jgi:hypothetical protein
MKQLETAAMSEVNGKDVLSPVRFEAERPPPSLSLSLSSLSLYLFLSLPNPV